MKKLLAIIVLCGVSSCDVIPAAAAKRQHITQAQCAQIRNAINTYGVTLTLIGARAKGYTDAQINYARRVCRV